MNKPFAIYIMSSLITLLITGLCLRLGYLGAAGIFTSATAVLIILGLPWGFYPNPLSVRKRNIIRVVLFVLCFHIAVFSIIGASDKIVEAFNVDNLTKSAETVAKTKGSLEETKDVLLKILKFEPVGFQNILWNYIIFFAGLSIAVYKLIASFGWWCSTTAATGISLCLFVLNSEMTSELKWLTLLVAAVFFFISFCFGRKTWDAPATV